MFVYTITHKNSEHCSGVNIHFHFYGKWWLCQLLANYLRILLIVAAHDTEVNTGSCRPKHPCQSSDKVNKWSQKGIIWDNCFGWYYADCVSMITHSYEKLNHTGVLWIC